MIPTLVLKVLHISDWKPEPRLIKDNRIVVYSAYSILQSWHSRMLLGLLICDGRCHGSK